MRFIGTLSTALACIQLAFAPLAMGEEAHKSQVDRVRGLLRATELGARPNLTVGEYYQKVRGQFPDELQKQMDVWVAFHRHNIMPQIRTATYKDAQGIEQVRLMVSDASGEVVVATQGTEENPSIKINNVVINPKNFNPENFIGKALEADSKLKAFAGNEKADYKKFDMTPSFHEFNNLTTLGKVQYFINLRETVEVSQKVLESTYGIQAANHKFNFKALYAQIALGEEVLAATSQYAGKSCIVAGWVSIYSANNRCGGLDTGRANLEAQIRTTKQAFSAVPSTAKCTNGNVPCNPIVYGFDSGNKMFCVASWPTSESNQATAKCDRLSPLKGDGDKQRIAKSWAAAMGKDAGFNLKDGKIAEADYNLIKENLSKLQSVVTDAGSACASMKKQLQDQKNACALLAKRAFDFSPDNAVVAAAVKEEEKKAAPVVAMAEKKNDELDKSQTPAGVDEKDKKKDEPPQEVAVVEKTDQEQKAPAAVAPETSKAMPAPKEESWLSRNGLGIGMGLLIGAGVGLLVGCLVWCGKKVTNNYNVTNVYIPPPRYRGGGEGGRTPPPIVPTSPPRTVQ